MADRSYISRNRGVVTASKLKAFEFCQFRYKLQYEDELESAEDASNPNFLIGSAFDLYVQDPKAYAAEYRVVDRRTAKAQEQADEDGVTLITPGIDEQVRDMAAEFDRQPLYRGITNPQVQIFAEVCGVQLKGTLDEVKPDEDLFEDVKTATVATMMSNDTHNYWRFQLALYFTILRQPKVRVVFKNGKEEIWAGRDFSARIIAGTKETGARSARAAIFEASPQGLAAYAEERVLPLLEQFRSVNDMKLFEAAERGKCLSCPMYRQCPHSKQIVPLTLL